jgi:hypothetical protein
MEHRRFLANSTELRLEEAHASLTMYMLIALLALAPVSLSWVYLSNRDHGRGIFWAAHPMPGARLEWFWWVRVVVRSVFGSKAMVDEGYRKVNYALP